MYFGYFCFKKAPTNCVETPGSVFRLDGFALVTQPLFSLHILFSKLYFFSMTISGILGYGFRGNYGVYERVYSFNPKWVRKKEKYANLKWILIIFCLRPNKNISFQVGFGINLNNVRNPDSAFPSAVSKTLEGMQANLQNPFWMFHISSFPFQNSVVEAIRYLRYFAKNVIEERGLALQNRDETPSDILEHIVKGAQENPEINMDDLVDNFLTIFIAGMNI